MADFQPRTKVLIAEDHTLVAEGLRALLRDTFELVGIAEDGRMLLEAAEKHKPDVIVTDVSMPGLNGLDAIRRLRIQMPQVKTIVLTMHRETQLAVEALRCGASGYMLKISPVEELITAIREVALGRVYVTTLLSKELISALIGASGQLADRESPLTLRQREVVQLVAGGKTMKQIASILQISPRTAESHKYEIMQALNLSTTAELIQYAIRNRLIGE